jgi:nucleoside-diphosphate-sugar epimerase
VNRTLAITGATGFVGSHVLEQALAGGQPVQALKRHMRMSDYLTDKPSPVWVEGTLQDRESLDRLCEGADAVIHIAGAVNVPTRDAFAAANIAGTQAIVDAATAAGVSRFVHVSSLAAREPALSNYGWSKAGAEDVVRASTLDWTIVRPPAIYGPRDSDMLELFRMAKRGVMLLPPSGRSSIIHAEDLARLLVVLASGGAHHAVLEPDDGAPLSHGDLAHAIRHAMGRKRVATLHAPRPLLNLAARADRLLRGDQAKLTPDRASYMAHPDWTSNLALRPDPALWQPKIAANDGLAATAHWYREQGWL